MATRRKKTAVPAPVIEAVHYTAKGVSNFTRGMPGWPRLEFWCPGCCSKVTLFLPEGQELLSFTCPTCAHEHVFATANRKDNCVHCKMYDCADHCPRTLGGAHAPNGMDMGVARSKPYTVIVPCVLCERKGLVEVAPSIIRWEQD